MDRIISDIQCYLLGGEPVMVSVKEVQVRFGTVPVFERKCQKADCPNYLAESATVGQRVDFERSPRSVREVTEYVGTRTLYCVWGPEGPEVKEYSLPPRKAS